MVDLHTPGNMGVVRRVGNHSWYLRFVSALEQGPARPWRFPRHPLPHRAQGLLARVDASRT